jgi:hypothetical protein
VSAFAISRFWVLFVVLAMWQGQALAQSSGSTEPQGGIGTARDCSDTSIGYIDDPSLTIEEKTALMDRALYNSLSRFDACQDAQAQSDASADGGGASGGGTAGDSGSGSNAGSAASGGGSVAASDMTGTEEAPRAAAIPNQDQMGGKPDDTASKKVNSGTNAEIESAQIGGNGKIPDDIPAADNDSVLEAQIRVAAERETDPAKKKQLWNEYRKYKGLAVKN